MSTNSDDRDDASSKEANTARESRYHLDEQVGFILRQANQRHATIFVSQMVDELTPTQWAALSKLYEKGACSQNLLGRMTAMDAATVKGVIDRLGKRGLIDTCPDPEDGRRLVVGLTEAGLKLVQRALPHALRISAATLAPLGPEERVLLLDLLKRII